MINYYVYATDDSLSTNSDYYFNKNALQTLEQFQNEIENISSCDKVLYLHWSAYCRQKEIGDVKSRYLRRNGEGTDTRPSEFIKWIHKNINLLDGKLKLLYMVTDGQISKNEANVCKNLLNEKPFSFERIVFYAINNNTEQIDLSVASAFVNNSDCKIYRNDEMVEWVNLTKEFNYDIITTENFISKKDELLSFVRFKFINSMPTDANVLNEVDKLKRLRQRLFSEIKQTNNSSMNFDQIKNKNEFVNTFKSTEFYKTLYNADVLNFDKIIDSTISTAINYLHNRNKSYAFDVMKNLHYQNKLASVDAETDDVVANDDDEAYDYSNVENIRFPDCILANDSGVPAILLTHYNLFETIQGSLTKFKSRLEFPLLWSQNKEIKNSIEYCYNLESLKQLIQHGTRLSPRSRRPFTGAIVPNEQFDEYNDYVLACTYFDAKKVAFNAGLMYYLLYKHINDAEYIDDNVKDYFKRYVIYRINNTECMIGFSNLAMEPLVKVKLPTALWYVSEISTLLFKHDNQHFGKEKLRQFAHFAEDMLQILQWCDYTDVNVEAVKKRAYCLKRINMFKRMSVLDAVEWIANRAFECKDKFIINKLTNADALQDLKFLKVNHNGVVDEHVLNDTSINAERYLYFYHIIEDFDKYISVVDNTMRPAFVLEEGKTFYDSLLKQLQSVHFNGQEITFEKCSRLDFNRILSLHKLYIECVKSLNKYPTLEEYQNYVYNQKHVKFNRIAIFPENILQNLAAVHNEYANKIVNLPVEEFIVRANNTVNRITRIQNERVGSPLQAEEIDKLIKLSEQRVNICRE